MNIFPSFKYVITSNKNIAEVRYILDELLKKPKYLGFWEDNNLFVSLIIPLKSMMTPDIKVILKSESDVSKISFETKLNYGFKILFLVILIFLLLIEIFAVRSIIIDKTFNMALFIPIIFVMFMYLIIYIRVKWYIDNFISDIRYKLK